MSDDLYRYRRAPGLTVAVVSLVAWWLVIQNLLLLAIAHAHAAPRPLVVARVLAGVTVKLATRYPVFVSLVLVTAALVIYLGFDLVRGREPLDDNA